MTFAGAQSGENHSVIKGPGGLMESKYAKEVKRVGTKGPPEPDQGVQN